MIEGFLLLFGPVCLLILTWVVCLYCFEQLRPILNKIFVYPVGFLDL